MSEPMPVGGHLRQMWSVLRAHVDEPAPLPPAGRVLDRLLYGFAQPLWGLRQVTRDTSLLGLALAPVLLVALVCAVLAWSEAHEQMDDPPWWRIVAAFFVSFGALAPVPPVLFARTYARIAARIRNEMGLGPREPYLRGLGDALWESIALVIVIAVGIAPLVAIIGGVPVLGAVWAAIVHGAWTLHWIIVEAFDTARTLEPGQSVAQVEREGAERPGAPWFARPWRRQMPWPLKVVTLPFKIFADIAAGLGARWRPEVDRVESHPWLTLGFGLGTVLLLAIPGVNLFFRPAIVIGAAHLCGRLDLAERTPAPAPGPSSPGRVGPTGTQPHPTVPS